MGRAALTSLGGPSVGLEDRWGWLIELDCDGFEGAGRVGFEGAGRVVRDGAWTSFLGELGLLGLRPLVAVVGAGSELSS